MGSGQKNTQNNDTTEIFYSNVHFVRDPFLVSPFRNVSLSTNSRRKRYFRGSVVYFRRFRRTGIIVVKETTTVS